MKKLTFWSKLSNAFDVLFPSKLPYRLFEKVMDTAIEEEHYANQQLFNTDRMTYPRVLQDMKKKGYTFTRQDIIEYLHMYHPINPKTRSQSQ